MDSSIHIKISSLRPDFQHFFTKEFTFFCIPQRAVLACLSLCSRKARDMEPAGTTVSLGPVPQHLLTHNTKPVWASLCAVHKHNAAWIKYSDAPSRYQHLVTLTFSSDRGHLNNWAKMNLQREDSRDWLHGWGGSSCWQFRSY